MLVLLLSGFPPTAIATPLPYRHISFIVSCSVEHFGLAEPYRKGPCRKKSQQMYPIKPKSSVLGEAVFIRLERF